MFVFVQFSKTYLATIARLKTTHVPQWHVFCLFGIDQGEKKRILKKLSKTFFEQKQKKVVWSVCFYFPPKKTKRISHNGTFVVFASSLLSVFYIKRTFGISSRIRHSVTWLVCGSVNQKTKENTTKPLTTKHTKPKKRNHLWTQVNQTYSELNHDGAPEYYRSMYPLVFLEFLILFLLLSFVCLLKYFCFLLLVCCFFLCFFVSSICCSKYLPLQSILNLSFVFLIRPIFVVFSFISRLLCVANLVSNVFT